MIRYELTKDNIYYVKLIGDVYTQDVLTHLEEFNIINHSGKTLLLLYDFTEINMKIPLFEIPSISKRTDEITKDYQGIIKTAFVVRKPILTAYAFMFADIKRNKRKIRKTFSSVENATKWLL